MGSGDRLRSEIAGERESLDMFAGSIVHLYVVVEHLLNNRSHLYCILLINLNLRPFA